MWSFPSTRPGKWFLGAQPPNPQAKRPSPFAIPTGGKESSVGGGVCPLTAIDGRKVVSADQLREELELAGPGATVTLTVFDEEDTSAINVTLKQRLLKLYDLLPG